MRFRSVVLALVMATGAGFVAGLLVESKIERVQAQSGAGSAFPAVPGQKGGEDITGPYEPVADWPQPLTGPPTTATQKSSNTILTGTCFTPGARWPTGRAASSTRTA